MEDWIDITTASWDGILSPAELGILSVETRTGELAKLAAEIRTMITTWSPNTVSADPLKIPPGFLGRAILVARNRLLTGIADYVIDEDRRKQAEQAETWFLEVARGRIRPEPATDAVANDTPSEKPSGVEVVNAPPKRTGRDKMNGL
jgi:hypothetical protein